MMFGFNKRKRNTVIGGGDFDRDGVKNIRDCEPLNWKKQDGGGQFMGGKDPFESHLRVTKEEGSGKWILSGKGTFEVYDTHSEAEERMRELK